jgi:Zn-dependent protease
MSNFSELTNSGEGLVILFGMLFLLLMTNACHEGGHALMAWWMGDRRKSILGRCTLNPLNHFHWFLTLVLPVLSLMLFGFLMGGAKPVMIHAGKIGPRRMALVALAGPVGNMLFAGFAVAVLSLGLQQGWFDDVDRLGDSTYRAAIPAIWFSLLLAMLNLVPLPPLDGSRMLAMFMPERVRMTYYRFAPLGLVLVLAGYLWVSGGLYYFGFKAFGPGYPRFFMGTMVDVIHNAVETMFEFWEQLL